jgi:branched-chain amino acid transport system substrate-binding protein
VRLSKGRSVSRAVVALVGVSFFATACGAGQSNDEDQAGGGGGSAAEVEGDATGITADAIKLGTHMPLTGPAAPGYSEIPEGQKAYFDFVNAAGGVCDRQIEYVVRDDGYNPTNTTSVVNQLVLQDQVFGTFAGLGTPTHSAVVDFLNDEQVPDLFVSSGSKQWNQPEERPYTFGWQPNYTVEGKIVGEYIAENFPGAKVGLFLQGDELGADGAEGIKQVIEDQVVAEVEYTTSNTDVGAQISELQAAGADFVVGFNIPAFTAISHLTAQRLNYAPQWFHSNVGSDPNLIGGLLSRVAPGTDPDAALEGTLTTQYFPTVEQTDNPWVQLWTRVWEEHGDKEELSNFRVYGMSNAYAMVSALQASCDNLNREAIVAAIEEQGSDFEGPWLAPLEYSAQSHRGITGLQVVQIQGGVTVPRTEVLTTDDGDGAIEPHDGEPAQPTENGLPNVG